MRIAVVGQPNSGKSTLFNAMAGYRSIASNFAGTTSRYTEGSVRLNEVVAEILDFPGCYSLSGRAETEQDIRKYLLSHHVDIVIDVVDASRLSRGLPLTLELIEIGSRVVLVLNMLDQATRRGIEIDIRALSEILGIPVLGTVASRNLGVNSLLKTIRAAAHVSIPSTGRVPPFHRDVERVVVLLAREVQRRSPNSKGCTPRFMATKLLEGDEELASHIGPAQKALLLRQSRELRRELAKQRGNRADTLMLLERYAVARDTVKRVTKVRTPEEGWCNRLDDVVMHRLWGYLILAAVLAGTFFAVFFIGSQVEGKLLNRFAALESSLSANLDPQTIWFVLLRGALTGLAGGAAVVLPYIAPFLLVMALLEDIGYLPRVAFLMDSLMQRFGLQGTAIIPVILGYGCTVPAVMATSILPSKRDRVVAGIIVTLVPCSARSVVIMGLAAYYLGIQAAVAVYVLNAIVIAATGRLMSRLLPSVATGMLMEMPDYRMPAFGALLKKMWFRIREFIIVAWPLLIAGSVLLGVADWLQWPSAVDRILSPLTHVLGLPATVGTVLIFGILRKELAPVMLMQALGTSAVLTVLTPGQIMTFTVFVTFYLPCLATIAALLRGLGGYWTVVVCGITMGLAIALALCTRLAFAVVQAMTSLA